MLSLWVNPALHVLTSLTTVDIESSYCLFTQVKSMLEFSIEHFLVKVAFGMYFSPKLSSHVHDHFGTAPPNDIISALHDTTTFVPRT